MRIIRDVLRVRLDASPSERRAARSLGAPRSTVQDYGARFRASERADVGPSRPRSPMAPRRRTVPSRVVDINGRAQTVPCARRDY